VLESLATLSSSNLRPTGALSDGTADLTGPGSPAAVKIQLRNFALGT
jgi:hypothetical protein